MATRTQTDEQLYHTVTEHLLQDAAEGLIVAIGESELMKDKDPRFAELLDKLVPLMNELDDIINDAYDTIPGMLSREEAGEKMDNLLNGLFQNGNLPFELPKDTPLQ
jgi:uncharacterized protein YdcH (DUF465 family)